MNSIYFTKATLRVLVVVSCLTLMIGLQVVAHAQLVQPASVATNLTPVQDSKVMLAGCTDSCCRCETASGKAVCCPRRVTEEVKKHCWKVKSEMICIPSFRFRCNWKKRAKNCDCGDGCCAGGNCTDCPPKCGRVRCINVLEKHEYTCEKCGYEWDVKCVRSGKKCCPVGGCDCPSCAGIGLASSSHRHR